LDDDPFSQQLPKGEFKRHCECSEAHQLKIYFYRHCGEYFTCGDTCQPYCDIRPARCLQVAPEETNEKCRATQMTHDRFIGKLEGHTGPPYWKIMNMFPDSVKRRQGVESIGLL